MYFPVFSVCYAANVRYIPAFRPSFKQAFVYALALASDYGIGERVFLKEGRRVIADLRPSEKQNSPGKQFFQPSGDNFYHPNIPYIAGKPDKIGFFLVNIAYNKFDPVIYCIFLYFRISALGVGIGHKASERQRRMYIFGVDRRKQNLHFSVTSQMAMGTLPTLSPCL